MKFVREIRKHDCSHNTIKQIEEKYNVLLPVDLVEYHLHYDNSPIEACCFEINGQLYSISEFYPFIHKGGLSFENINDKNKKNGFIPDEFYAFASDRGGNDFYWNCKNNKIYYISWDDIYLHRIICNNMKQFFDILRESKN